MLEAFQEPRQGSRTDCHVAPHLDVAPSQFTGHNASPLLRGWLLNPKQIIGQQLAKAAVDFTDPLGPESTTASQATTVNPLLDRDVGLGFEL